MDGAKDSIKGTILLASEGRPISSEAIAKAAQLARKEHAKVHVLSVARIWGTAFGLQHPGLFPTRGEIESQRQIISKAIDELEQQKIEATGEILRSRAAARAIAAKARQRDCLGIVMTADPKPHWLMRPFLWSHEPYRVGRLSKLPVHLVVDAGASSAA
jgi:nucleotide-binding universal stress UspA family protein